MKYKTVIKADIRGGSYKYNPMFCRSAPHSYIFSMDYVHKYGSTRIIINNKHYEIPSNN